MAYIQAKILSLFGLLTDITELQFARLLQSDRHVCGEQRGAQCVHRACESQVSVTSSTEKVATYVDSTGISEDNSVGPIHRHIDFESSVNTHFYHYTRELEIKAK